MIKSVSIVSGQRLQPNSAGTLAVSRLVSGYESLGYKVYLYGVGFYSFEGKSVVYTRYAYGSTRFLTLYTACRALIDILRKLNGACNEVHSRNVYFSFAYGLFKSNRNHIFEVHYFKEGLFLRLVRAIAKNGVKVVYISHALRRLFDRFIDSYSGGVCVLHSGSSDIPVNSRKANESNTKITIGFFGSIGRDPGEKVLYEIPNHLTDIRFIYCLNDRNSVAKAAFPSNVLVLRNVDQVCVSRSMALCDIVISPYAQPVRIGVRNVDTYDYMSPVKVFEAMACGKVVIASGGKSMQEIIINRFNGILINQALDILEWVRAINDLRSVRSRKEIQKNSLYIFERKYRMVDRIRIMRNV